MAKYVIGDIHGCGEEFARLLDELAFNPSKDELYLAGDLIGRGTSPQLVFDLAIKHQAQAVLGNYDLHFLACLHGARQAIPSDNFEQILNLDAKKRNYYGSWLQEQGFVREEDGFYLVHASLDPSWSAEQITTYGKELSTYFASWQTSDFMHFFSNKRFIDGLKEFDYTQESSLRHLYECLFIFTVCRYRKLTTVDESSILFPQSLTALSQEVGLENLNNYPWSVLVKDFQRSFFDIDVGMKGEPICMPEQRLYPWFEFARMLDEQTRLNPELVKDNPNLQYQGFTKPVYFGHWSRLNGHELVPGIICTDTSCVYGDRLTAYQLSESAVNMQDLATLKQLAQPVATVYKDK
ncbi:metallophosphoesterase [Psittacicella hinzii]|uniref:Calcineurin-like phosphoesterase domain-containing protein n=1 Tax=Psittacicella hinzii TaxID=2028575 RepID=A0A3A1YNS4_9GAMM|nr:metallophosphoesterase [Psittacicella hinzii]RIY38889.1 hypothetical protein CKF58_03195 [Psittacicella hinzii]